MFYTPVMRAIIEFAFIYRGLHILWKYSQKINWQETDFLEGVKNNRAITLPVRFF